MKCFNCNSEVSDGMQFCPYCGSPMVFQEQPQQPQQPQQGQYQQPNQGQYQQPYQEMPQQEQSQPSQIGVVLKFVEYFFYILAAADFLLGTFGIIDITGWRWSPVLFGVIGACIGQYVKQKYGIVDDDEE